VIANEGMQDATRDYEASSQRAIPQQRFVERTRCPACDSTRLETLLQCPYVEPRLLGFLQHSYPTATDLVDWLSGADYRLDACVACHLVYQRFVGSDELLSVLYDEWLNEQYQPASATFRSQLARPALTRDGHELFAVARTLHVPVQRLRVLDYGMGWGLWARIAKKLGAETFGCDLSALRCDDARASGIGIIQAAEFAGMNADFVNADQILEHVSDPRRAVRDMASALRRGGILKIAVPQARDIRRRLAVLDWYAPKYTRDSLNPVHPLEHVNCFDTRALETLGARAGLRRVSISWSAYAAFLGVPGAVSLADPLRLAKAFARPAYHHWSRNNLYAWFVK
jgi:2-polyprenyl-3-methyl-5-hydroxy-6-metoxy-1,4-benzoquinol methylase